MRLLVRISVAVIPIALIGSGVAFALGVRTPTPAARHSKINSGSLIASRTIDGLRITLRVPARSEPAGALIRSRVTVRNVSRSPINLIGDGCSREPYVQLLDASGMPYPPPAFTGVWECAYSAPHPLIPGARVTSSLLVWLQSGRVRPAITIYADRSTRQVTGSVIHLHLTRAPSPRVVLRSGSSGQSAIGFTASVRSEWKHSGRLYVESFESCMQATGGGTQTGSSYWGAVKGPTIRTSILSPSCHSQLWHFYAGWIGHPIVRFRLVVPKGSQPGY